MSSKIRVGIIGCGIGDFHAEAYLLDPRAEVITLAGLDVDRCLEVCKKNHIPEHTTNYEEILARADIDAVSVCVPNYLHKPIAIAALRAGKHVLLEKPIALDAKEGEEICAEAEMAGKVLGIAFSRRYRGDVQLFRKHILDGALGDIYYAKAFWMRRAGIPGLGSWFTSKTLAGGGSLIDVGVHVIDMVLYLMGNPVITTVSGATYSKLGPQGKGQWAGARFRNSTDNVFEVDDLATAMLRTADGATIQIETSWASFSSVTDEYGVALMGDKGGGEIHVHDYQKTGALKLFSDVHGVPTDLQPRTIIQHEHHSLVEHFLNSIIDGTPMSPSGQEWVDRARVIDLIYQSSVLGREINVAESMANATVATAV
jgi:predicted dehydrogenase